MTLELPRPAPAAQTQPSRPSAPRGRHERGPAYAMPFYPHVEGLRALAVLLVVGYHAGVPGLSGGFVGVDVFFVVSGFLITGLLLTEVSDTGTVSLSGFYARRARRIVPGVVVVVLVTGAVSALVLTPLAQQQVATDMVAAALFVANWRFAAQGQDYAGTDSAASPLLHLWSLSVEEQLYLVWPVLVLVVVVLASRWLRSWRPALTGVLVAVTGASLLHALSNASEPSAYFDTAGRAWQFGAGALLALAAPAVRRLGVPGLRATAGALGFVAVCAAAVTLHPQGYPGPWSLIPVVATLLVIAAGVHERHAVWPVRALSMAPVRAVGRLSFAWYLWHWPVLVLGAAVLGSTLSWPAAVALGLASAVPALLTMRLVERPLRFSPTFSVRSTAGLSLGVVASVVALLAGLLLARSSGTELAAQAVAAPPASSADLSRLVEPPSSASSATAATAAPSATPRTSGPVVPAPADARDDIPAPADCQLPLGAVTGPDCEFGPVGGTPVVLFGDSHAQQWQGALIGMAEERGWRLHVATKSGCPVARLQPQGTGERYELPDCTQWREAWLERMREDVRPAIVIVSSRDNYVDDAATVRAAWASTLSDLESTGATVVHVRDTPYPDEDVPACVSGSLDDWSACSLSREAVLGPDPVAALQAQGLAPDVRQVDLTDRLCGARWCPAVRDGVLIYRDESHLTATAARMLAPLLASELEDALAATPRGRLTADS